MCTLSALNSSVKWPSLLVNWRFFSKQNRHDNHRPHCWISLQLLLNRSITSHVTKGPNGTQNLLQISDRPLSSSFYISIHLIISQFSEPSRNSERHPSKLARGSNYLTDTTLDPNPSARTYFRPAGNRAWSADRLSLSNTVEVRTLSYFSKL